MKKFRTLLALMAVAVIATLSIGKIPVSAASVTDITIKIGKEKTIEGYKYYGSTDTSIATVTSKGVIKGIAVGTCKIAAIDSSNNATVFTVEVIKKKNAGIEIAEKGMKWSDQVFNASGAEITLGKTTIKELYEQCEANGLEVCDKNGVEYDLDSKAIMNGNTNAYIIDRTGDYGRFKYYITAKSTSTKYYKDMIITRISVCNADTKYYTWSSKTDDPATDFWWTDKTFAPENAPAYEKFKKQFLKKFYADKDKYLDKNITIKSEGKTNYKVWIRLYGNPDYYYNGSGTKTQAYKYKTYYAVLTYYYDEDTRECYHVDYYITTDKP